MIAIAGGLIGVALLFYTVAIWTERMRGTLLKWMLIVFFLGFLSDLIGTSMMFFIAKEKFSFEVHSIAGYLALIIMFLHLIWAIMARLKIGKSEICFTKFSIYAWIVWMVAFFSGIPKI